MNDTIRGLARAISNPNPGTTRPTSTFRTGTVTSTSPLTLQLPDGTSVAGVKRLSSYTAAVGHIVRYEQYGPTLLVLGNIV